MRVYLDNCCFNRPFDEQTQIRIALETQAVLFIQTQIVQNMIELIWSYVLTYESGKNPYSNKKESIRNFARKYAVSVVLENDRIIEDANRYQKDNVNKLDALHLACAKDAAADFFITTDDRLLKYRSEEVKIISPIDFVLAWTKGELR
ncbi:hypothetical protein FACS1894170_11100 [Planctomycetales bacterium]|nr:hypothetical protein FACS1894170_11100 [Planctomycetales bacterium]